MQEFSKYLAFGAILVFATYPIWAIPAFIAICIAKRSARSNASSITKAALATAIATAICTPAAWGTEGFGWFVPWFVTFIDASHTILYSWQVPAVIYVTGLVFSLLTRMLTNRVAHSA